MIYEVELMDLPDGIVALKQKIGLQAPTRIKQDVELVLPRNLRLPFENRKVFLPLKNGIGRRQPVRGFGSDNEYLYSMAGVQADREAAMSGHSPWWMNTATRPTSG